MFTSKMKSLLSRKWVKFSIVLILFLLWVIWVGNYWLILFTTIIFDTYITKRVHWAFWKKKGVKKQTKIVEWADAMIFAVVAASIIRIFFIEAYTIPTSSMEKSMLVGDYLFVSKMSYGPKLPNTPLAIPFMHHTIPGTKSTKAYSELIKMPYKRIAGLGDVKRDDIVVFNFPAGDTVLMESSDTDIYRIRRSLVENFIEKDKNAGNKIADKNHYKKLVEQYLKDNGETIVRPVDKRENYIKRCVAIPGDILEINDGNISVNGSLQNDIKTKQYSYIVKTNGSSINPKKFSDLNISKEDYKDFYSSSYDLPLTYENVEKLKALPNVLSVKRVLTKKGEWDTDIFPFSPDYRWNRDNFGPLRIPKAGETVQLTLKNLPIYDRIINAYEGNTLSVKDSTILINGKLATSYTFKMNYYWMMGDNRHRSADSRFWGFVPEDHIVGKALFIWLSLDKDKSFLSKIRFDRIFRFI
ncbi:MAG: signal peptidase I [Marinifilaceae bacterium]